MAALGTFVAGRYTTTFNATDVGITEEGYKLRHELKEIPINKTDAYGDMLIDSIFRGIDWTLTWLGIEYKAGSTAPQFGWAAIGVVGVIGRLGTSIVQTVVMTATTGTPAAAAPATLTATAAKVSPKNNFELTFTSDLRKVPIMLDLLAYDSGAGVIKHLTTT
jgi:hypothetical protein